MRAAPAWSSRAARSTGRTLAAQALRLATGERLDGKAAIDWPALHALAERERLAPLAWLRSAAVITASAPEGVTSAWRRSWLAACSRGYRALSLTGELTEAVESRSGSVVALKGAGLAQLLYGDPSARPTTDIDVYVPQSSRAIVTQVASELGWIHAEGRAPGDEVFVRHDSAGELFLEIHASLLGERLRFLPVPAPRSARMVVEGVSFAALDGPLLPAYLAAHLAGHVAPPLLWWLDWWTLGRTMDDAAREAALGTAAGAGLLRYLRWAERRSASVGEALAGDPDALAAVGVRRSGARRDVHQLIRHITLAPGATASAAAVKEWVRPAWAGERDGGMLLGTLRRLGRHWRLLLPMTVGGPAATARAARPFAGRLAGSDDAARIRATLVAGGEAWMRVGGHSMSPTIAAGDSVLLTRPPHAPRRGDIVLNAAGPTPMLHRVAWASRDVVVTRGDACETDDPKAPADAMVARAVALRRGEVVAALTPTFRFGVAALVRFWLRSLRRRQRVGSLRSSA